MLTDLSRLIAQNGKGVPRFMRLGQHSQIESGFHRTDQERVLVPDFPWAGGPIVRAIRDLLLRQGQEEQGKLALLMAALWFPGFEGRGVL